MAFVKSTNIITDTALTVAGLTGGSNGKVVRISGNNTVTNASWLDTAAQLNAVLFRNDGIFYAAGVVPNVGGLTAGTAYFIDEFGGLTASPPAPSSTIRVLFVGFGLNTTDLLFRPGIPISG
jgi:hypothetical protein